MSEARWSRVATAEAAVELVMSRRGKPKAKYAGRTFTLDTRSDQRYRWRCDVRQCRSRLTTDLYENRHMVYRFREHDEDQHRRVASERKRRDATYRQQVNRPAKKIGDYRYVLENRIGGLHFWRCEYVSCPGRCRTHDGHLVAGPSQHTHEPNTALGESDKVHEGEDASYTEFHLDAYEKAPPGTSEAITTDTNSQQHLLLQQRQQELSNQIPSGRVDSPVVIKSEPCSPVTTEAATTSDVGITAGAVTGAQTHTADLIGDKAIQAAGNDVPLCRASVSSSCPDQRNSSQTAYDEAPAADAPEDRHYVDSSDYEGNDVDEEAQWPPTSGGAAPSISEAMDDRSSAAARYGIAAGAEGHHAGVAEVLRITAESAHCLESELRVDILLQMRRLLEAETDLVNEKRRNEVLRGQLLRRELLGIVPEREPAPPYI